MKRRIFAAGLFLSLFIICSLSACASGAAPSAAPAPAASSAAAASEAASSAVSAGASETAAASSPTGASDSAAAVSESAAEGEAPVLWSAKEMPVSLKYDRNWIYSAHAETEDPEVIARIVDAVKSLSVGEKANYVVDDFTDLLLFTFPDGSTCRLEFEEDNWVAEGSGRLHVEGLSQLRALLDKLLGDQVQR